jgi:hypothetical protein
MLGNFAGRWDRACSCVLVSFGDCDTWHQEWRQSTKVPSLPGWMSSRRKARISPSLMPVAAAVSDAAKPVVLPDGADRLLVKESSHLWLRKNASWLGANDWRLDIGDGILVDEPLSENVGKHYSQPCVNLHLRPRMSGVT